MSKVICKRTFTSVAIILFSTAETIATLVIQFIKLDPRTNWNLECWFLRSGENWSTREKPLGARKEPPTNSNQIWRPLRDSNPGHSSTPAKIAVHQRGLPKNTDDQIIFSRINSEELRFISMTIQLHQMLVQR